MPHDGQDFTESPHDLTVRFGQLRVYWQKNALLTLLSLMKESRPMSLKWVLRMVQK